MEIDNLMVRKTCPTEALGLNLAKMIFTKMSEPKTDIKGTAEQPIYLKVTPKLINNNGHLAIQFDSQIIELP